MPPEIDQTHDPKLESWVESANDPGTDFPIQNLPIGLVEVERRLRTCVRIGDSVLLLEPLVEDFRLRQSFADLPPNQYGTGFDIASAVAIPQMIGAQSKEWRSA